jgi:hypothetical protein
MVDEKRVSERKDHFGSAFLEVAGVRHEGSVFNVSVGGALVALDTEVSAGTKAILEIAGIDLPIPCTVLRDTDEGTHLKFESAEAAAQAVEILGL